MDAKSHQLFTGTLLSQVKDNITSSEWGIAPDIDMKFLHRWYRHRISVLPQIFREFNGNGSTEDKDSVVLGIVSHLYLDIFNAWVFPFGFTHPVMPEYTILKDVLEDMNSPALLMIDLKNLSGMSEFCKMFYAEAEGIMKEFASNPEFYSKQIIIQVMVDRLAMISVEPNCSGIYQKAMKDIAAFTGDKTYRIMQHKMSDACERFEITFADLINKAVAQ